MIRQSLTLLLGPAVVGLVLLGAAGAGAQVADIEPVPYNPADCVASRYDLNGDGTLNKGDVLYFEREAARCMDRFGNALPGVVCDPRLDVNQDGKVDKTDLEHLYRYILVCLYPPRPNTGLRPGQPVIPPPEQP